MLQEQSTSTHRNVIEVGGPGGIRIASATPLPSSPSPAAQRDASPALRLAARHSKTVAAGLVVVGLALLLGPLVLLSALGLPAWLFIGPVLLSAIAFGGAILVARGSLAAFSRSAHEHRILDLAARNGGRLTVAFTARQLSLSLAEAEDVLTALARTGYADIAHDPDSAAVIYVFSDFVAQMQLPSKMERP